MKIKEAEIRKYGNSFCFIIPKAYIKDGNLSLSRRYNLLIEDISTPPNPLNNELIAEKTQEIIAEITKNANRTKEANLI